MSENEDTGSPSWSGSYIMRATEDVVISAASAAASVRSPRPSVVYSCKDDNGSNQLQKLQHQVTKALKGSSPSHEAKKGAYNPEVLTSQKRQWARFQLQSLDQKCLKEPSRLFESMVVVGLHPKSDVRSLKAMLSDKKSDGFRGLKIFNQHNDFHNTPMLDPQILFVYPPEKRLPLNHKDLLSFCFPSGVEVHAVERTPSMSELNEILLGQENFKQNDLSFVFRLQVADDSTLYGCCVLVEEIVQKPSGLIALGLDENFSLSSLGHHILTTPRCYCILSRLPFFDLHFGVLKSIFTEERLERLTEGIDGLNLVSADTQCDKGNDVETFMHQTTGELNEPAERSEVNILVSTSEEPVNGCFQENHVSGKDNHVIRSGINCQLVKADYDMGACQEDCGIRNGFTVQSPCWYNPSLDRYMKNKENDLHGSVSPIRCHTLESFETCASYQGPPSVVRNFRSNMDGMESEEASSSGQDDSSNHEHILEWAKANGHGCLQIVCEYHQLCSPQRGSSITFHPLEHLHSLSFDRPGEPVIHVPGSSINLKSCRTSLEVNEAYNELLAEEEAICLSVWTVACICGNLRLDHVLVMFAAALLEKQIVFVCSNLGLLSACVLSIIPLIRPYQWQSLLMPVLPDDMLDFLDAPVPYIVKCPTMPQLPQQKDLLSSLSSYHATLVGESFLAKRRPVYECTDIQAEAARGFLAILRSYLETLCSSLRAHTITNVQSHDDKVSLLLKESFIDSFPVCDRPFMKLFVDTQLFSVHTDLVLSFYQKDY
ncbi:uncharacterized protein LOC116262143 isoform X2 [Nymphaea colorata]|uniref:uncharacterized protein LOC116262143 isoform X2 n=1 Tax=Nymphaea colorata TaxID=210225 RepID=UPI00129EC7E0|nr:uncharacterized protein LOC116262143 isoform X2 [Nymphaea colorata]